MTKFEDGEISQILPPYLKDSLEAQAISYALHRQMERYASYCQIIGVYAMIDNATDNILDMLALDLNTQYYDETLNVETKRKLIKGTLGWYTHIGTPAAIKEMIAAIYGYGDLEEWFEYDGNPGAFRISINISGSDEEHSYTDDVNKIQDLIENVKRASANFEGLYYMLRAIVEVSMSTKTCVIRTPKCGTIRCGTYPKRGTLGELLLLQTEVGIEQLQAIFEETKCGTIRVGGKLYNSTLGELITDDVEIEVSSDYEIQNLYLAGQLVSGTYPIKAVNGYVMGSSTETDATVTNVTTDPPLTGTLITGDTSGTVTTDTVVTVSEEVDVTPTVCITVVSAQKCGTSVCGE